MPFTKHLNKADTIILGAGPAGIAAGIALGRDAIVLERGPKSGGLAGSVEIEGAVFDVGGHSFHTPHPELRKLVFSAVEMYEQKREAHCYFHGSMIPYPFQDHFHEVKDPGVVDDCARGLLDADGSKEAANLEEFLRCRFGAGISRHFLIPYNQKLWGKNLKRLSVDWVGQRIPGAEESGQGSDANGGKRNPLQSDSRVAYPARGGFGEIALALTRLVQNLRFGTRVVRVDPLSKVVATEEGERFKWERLVSTIPINELLKITDAVPPSLLQEAARLEYLSVKLILVVIGHPVDTDIQRIYIAQDNIPIHKIVINHNSSPYLRSLPHHAITGEVSYSHDKRLEPNIQERFLQSLVDLKLIKDQGEVLKTILLDIKYAYPIPTPEREIIVNRLKDWLAQRNIYSIGRFGEWAYINSDEAMCRGFTMGRSLSNSRLSGSA